MNTPTIAKREMGSYFTSLIAYVVTGVFLLMSGYFYYTNMVMFVMFVGSDVKLGLWQQTFYDIRFVTVSLLPLLTMRLFAEEKKLGTIELLFTSPLRDMADHHGQISCLPGRVCHHAGADAAVSGASENRLPA